MDKKERAALLLELYWRALERKLNNALSEQEGPLTARDKAFLRQIGVRAW